MKIDRVEVSGGFLDGLRLNFVDGLNVAHLGERCGKDLGLRAHQIRARGPGNDAGRGMPRPAGKLARYWETALSPSFAPFKENSLCSRGPVLTIPRPCRRPTAMCPRSSSPRTKSRRARALIRPNRRTILDRLMDPAFWNDLSTEDTRARLASLERRLERLRDERESFADRVAKFDGLPELLGSGTVRARGGDQARERGETAAGGDRASGRRTRSGASVRRRLPDRRGALGRLAASGCRESSGEAAAGPAFRAAQRRDHRGYGARASTHCEGVE